VTVRITPSTYPGKPWLVWHVPTCQQLKNVVWVDDEARTYCQHVIPLQVIGNQVATRIERARQITVNVDAALILVDPIEDASTEPRIAVTLLPQPQPVGY
jgi:hypothetical protein